MKKRIALIVLTLCLLASVSSNVCVFAAGYTTKDGATPPTQFKNDGVFYDDKNFPCVSHSEYNSIFVPIEMFIGFHNVIYFSDEKGGMYLASESSISYISFDSNSQSAYSSRDGVVENKRLTVRRHIYVDAEYCCEILGLKFERSTVNDMLVIRISDKTVTTTFDDVLREYVRTSDEQYELSQKNNDQQPSTVNDVAIALRGEYTEKGIRDFVKATYGVPVAVFFDETDFYSQPLIANIAAVNGYAVGVDMTGYSDKNLPGAINNERTVRQSLSDFGRICTRLALCSEDGESLSQSSPALYEYLVQNGYRIVAYNTSQDRSQSVSKRVSRLKLQIEANSGVSLVEASCDDKDFVKKLKGGSYAFAKLDIATNLA